jgi:hypothetical protein
MKRSISHYHQYDADYCVCRKGQIIFTLKNIRAMATINIDVEDNGADLATLVTNFQTAYTALQAATLSGLSAALTDLDTAQAALAAFQITFTASVVDATPPPTA